MSTLHVSTRAHYSMGLLEITSRLGTSMCARGHRTYGAVDTGSKYPQSPIFLQCTCWHRSLFLRKHVVVFLICHMGVLFNFR